MRTIRSISTGLACCVLLGAMSAGSAVYAQSEAAPDAKPAEGAAAAEEAKGLESEPVIDDAMINEIKKHAELCSEAQMKMDFEKILPYVPKKLLDMMGGKDVLRGRLMEGNAMLKSRGVTIDSAEIGKPEMPQRHGGVLASLVPMTTHLTTPQGKLVASSHMIGISEDKGATWVFVDTATVNEEKLGTLYPTLKGKVKIPPATAKALEKK